MRADLPIAYDHVWLNARLVDDAEVDTAACAIFVSAGRVAAISPMAAVSDVLADRASDLHGAWVSAALIDCHTHLVYGGNRAEEWGLRLAGLPYAEIARRGGGIASTVRATRGLSEDALLEAALPRAQALAAEGVGCIEIKSGYGLTLADELKMLRVARRVGELARVEVSATLLAAHTVPPEYAGRGDDYVTLICEEIIPAVAEAGLADAVDVFCEHIGFSLAQTERIYAAAQGHGLAIKGHMEQLSNLHGSELAARLGAWSVDHLEYLDETGIAALAARGTVAVLLPGAFYFLREKQLPPVSALRAAGVPMALATDCNPGTSPFASLRMMLNLGCTLFGLTPQEALAGVTRHAARALGRGDRLGTLAVGMEASFCVWNIEHPAELAYQLGVNPLKQRIWRGETV